jgi:hypothetical protein
MHLMNCCMRPMLIMFSAFCFTIAHAQVGVGTTTPDNSAQLEVSATNKGMLVPRMTSAQIALIPSPAPALMVYQTNGVAGFYYNAGTSVAPVWRRVGDEAETTGNVQFYITATSTTFNVPAGIYRIYYEIVGGGGGRGGTYLNGLNSWGGGGGGGGGFSAGYITVTPAEVLTIVVGGSGTNGSNGTPGTDGTDGSPSSIASGATTLIGVGGGGKGLAGTVSTSGNGGTGASLTALDTRVKLRCIHWPALAGIPGAGGSSTAALSGESGIVSSMGMFNKHGSFVSGTTGGSTIGAVNVAKPYYGIGGGVSNAPIWGYIVLYW